MKAEPANFHPLIATWFAKRYGKPTPVQAEAWPLINEGKNVLALAPTGSGKTLTSFLAALSRFVEGAWDTEKLSVLYVSPLKALNEDIRRNLLEPIASLEELAADKLNIEGKTEDVQQLSFKTNNAGGMLGGISNGMDLMFRAAFKPVSSIGKQQETVDRGGNKRELAVKGRHDVCILPRVVPVVEAMTALVLADLMLEQRCSVV